MFEKMRDSFFAYNLVDQNGQSKIEHVDSGFQEWWKKYGQRSLGSEEFKKAYNKILSLAKEIALQSVRANPTLLRHYVNQETPSVEEGYSDAELISFFTNQEEMRFVGPKEFKPDLMLGNVQYKDIRKHYRREIRSQTMRSYKIEKFIFPQAPYYVYTGLSFLEGLHIREVGRRLTKEEETDSQKVRERVVSYLLSAYKDKNEGQEFRALPGNILSLDIQIDEIFKTHRANLDYLRGELCIINLPVVYRDVEKEGLGSYYIRLYTMAERVWDQQSEEKVNNYLVNFKESIPIGWQRDVMSIIKESLS